MKPCMKQIGEAETMSIAQNTKIECSSEKSRSNNNPY